MTWADKDKASLKCAGDREWCAACEYPMVDDAALLVRAAAHIEAQAAEIERLRARAGELEAALTETAKQHETAYKGWCRWRDRGLAAEADAVMLTAQLAERNAAVSELTRLRALCGAVSQELRALSRMEAPFSLPKLGALAFQLEQGATASLK